MITGKQIDVLMHLARYGYLTARQIQRLGTYSDKASLYGALDTLGRWKLITGTDPQNMPGAGRFPGVYTLTEAGAAEIGAAMDRALKPLRGAKLGAPPLDVAHRTGIVDCHIALDAWATAAGHQVERFTPDFGPSNQIRRRATAMQTPLGEYAPDAVAMLACADGIKRPVVLEVYRGGVTDRPGYMRGKLPEVLAKIATKEVREAMSSGVQGEISAVRLLIVTATDTLRDGVLDRPPAPELPGWRVAYLKTLAEVEFDFAGDWWRVPKRREGLFSMRESAPVSASIAEGSANAIGTL